jgi:two-component system, response regulator YesN
MENEMIYTIVVAEDEELILNNTVKKINSLNMGFTVVKAAQDGKEALEYIDKLSPDVLITDIHMPVLDGLELIKQVYSKYPHILKVVISGYDDFKYAQQAMKYEVKEYLLKPLKKEILVETLSRIRICLDARKKLLKHNVLQLTDNHTYSPEEIAHMVEHFIKENYMQEINFDLIAQNFKFNSSYLSKIFTKYIGENPSKYLIALRINKAKHLLITERDLAVKEIGELVGYPDQFHFSHKFKALTGRSPLNYREESRIK